tara:strand:+ start:190 stop:1395 length:1206 start_codon:yes stop_codon:yes gene_type:complete
VQAPRNEAGAGGASAEAAEETEADAAGPARSAEAAKAGAQADGESAAASKDQTAASSAAQTNAKPQDLSDKAQPNAPAATESAKPDTANPAPSASAQAGAANAQGQSQSQAQAQAQAQAQTAQQDASAQPRRTDSDRAPGAQNKARQADNTEASAARPAASAAQTRAAANARPTGAEPTASAAKPADTFAPAVTAYTDPLTFLLQDTALSSEAPMEPSADTIDPDLELGAVRSDARTEAQRPGQAQAHTAARFAPTTTHTLAAQIARKFNDGARVFDIRLDPPELGRVEVRLELGPDNKVSAVLSAERADTLSELQRSARDLEKALTDAGLELGEDGLSFSLSEDGGAFTNFDDDAGASANDIAARNRFTAEVEADLPGAPLADALYGFAVSQRAGVNLIA